MKKENNTILIFDPFSRAGGGKAYLINIIKVLNEIKSINIHFIFFCNPALRDILPNVKEPHKIVWGPDKIIVGGIKNFLWQKRYSSELIKNLKFNYVIAMNQCFLKTQKPKILFLRNALYFSMKDKIAIKKYSLKQKIINSFWKYYSKKSIKNSDLLLTSSNSFANLIKSDLNDSSLKIAVNPFGLNNNTVSIRKRNYKEYLNLLSLQFNFYKDFETLFYSLKKLVAEFPQIKLNITDDLKNHNLPEGRKAYTTLKEQNLLNHVNFYGVVKQENLREYYNKADVFIFSSVIESFGQGLLEAMANGLPCVVSDIPVFREIGKDSILYFNPGDSYDLSNKLKLLLNDCDLRANLGNKAKKRAAEFSWEKHVFNIKQIVSTL